MAADVPHFVVGSTSPHKVGAVHDAMRLVRMGEPTLTAVAVRSGIPNQPIGLGETTAGATARAEHALTAEPAAHYAIGIESGAINLCDDTDYYAGFEAEYVDLAVVVLLERATGKRVRTTSTGVPVPLQYIQKARASLCSQTAGQFFAEAHPGCDATDMCTTLTAGHITRRLQLVQAIAAALMIMVIDPKEKRA
jgi:non-canonical (house-cleaning) NTP pyrophosphatase